MVTLRESLHARRLMPGTAMLLSTWFVIGLACLFLDDTIQPALNKVGHTPVIQPIADKWQRLGSAAGVSCFLVGGLIASCWDGGRTAIRFAAAISAASLAVQATKYVVGRARPDWVHDTTRFFGPFGMFNSGDYLAIDSMPSGHTTAAFAMAAALSHRWPRISVLWFLLAAGVGLARTLLDRHFPSDVILGALLGTVVGTVVYRRLTTIAPPKVS